MKRKELKQQYTSANTSINKEPPAIYKLVADRIKETDRVIDYGCGKFFDDYHLPNNFFGYDPYNRPDEEVLEHSYDIALCSNVMNVIMEKEVRIELLEILKELAPVVFITVYEKDGDGIGKVSKPDCYQLNRKKRDYLREIVFVFGEENVKYRKGYFECIA